MKVEYIPVFRIEAVNELDGIESYYSCSDTETQWRNDNHSSEDVILAKTAELEAEWTANEYARSRAEAYDSIGNQLDMIYKDNLNGTTTHKASVEAVKAKYPKPS